MVGVMARRGWCGCTTGAASPLPISSRFVLIASDTSPLLCALPQQCTGSRVMWGYNLGAHVSATVVEELYNRVEVAGPRAHANCRRCSKKIAAGALRVHRGGGYFHLRCFTPSQKGRAQLPPEYWFPQGEFTEEHRATLAAWTEKEI